jgi:hypothetical protein
MKTIPAILIALLGYLQIQSQSNYSFCFSDTSTTIWRPMGGGNYFEGDRSIKVLPVVVHVIYQHAFLDIQDHVVQSLLADISKDFRRQNADTINTPDVFKSVAADTEIEFELASVDPNGNPTTGITHTMGTFAWDLDYHYTTVMKFDSTGGKSAWDTNRYINIWLMGAVIAAPITYSTFPSAHGDPRDGVFMVYNSDYSQRYLTHELGHYLGLRHPYGDGVTCSTEEGGNDGLMDTPNQFNYSYYDSCLVFPTTDICSPDFPGIMFMNHMDGSHPRCRNLFTAQQAGVMNFVIDSIRYSLGESLSGAHSSQSKSHFEISSLSPNPTSGNIAITFSQYQTEQREYNLYDNLGKLVFSKVIPSINVKRDEFDISHIPSGFYWLMVKTQKYINTYGILKN